MCTANMGTYYTCKKIWKERSLMSKIYAISDVHGCLDLFLEKLALVDLGEDNRLVLLGDYIDYGPDSEGVLRKVFWLEDVYGSDKVIVLRGNHEQMLLDDMQEDRSLSTLEPALIKRVSGLRRYYETRRQIFVHAGIDESAGRRWKWETKEDLFLWKNPPTEGWFYKTVIAGHVGTSVIAKDPAFHKIYYDGARHYYIDGSAYAGGELNLLVYDDVTGKYAAVTSDGCKRIIRRNTDAGNNSCGRNGKKA